MRLALVCFIAIAPLMAQDASELALAEEYAGKLATPAGSAKLALGLLFAQGTAAIPEWGSGREGLRRRAEFLSAGYLARYSAEFVTAKALGSDTSYRRCQCKGFPSRAAHAVFAEFTEGKADGSRGFATARMTGIVSSVAITAPMLPARYGAGEATGRAIATIGIDEGFNMLHEFWPEIRRTLLFQKRQAQ